MAPSSTSMSSCRERVRSSREEAIGPDETGRDGEEGGAPMYERLSTWLSSRSPGLRERDLWCILYGNYKFII